MVWTGVTILRRSLPTAAAISLTGTLPTRLPETGLRDAEELGSAAVGPGCGTSIDIQLGRQVAWSVVGTAGVSGEGSADDVGVEDGKT